MRSTVPLNIHLLIQCMFYRPILPAYKYIVCKISHKAILNPVISLGRRFPLSSRSRQENYASPQEVKYPPAFHRIFSYTWRICKDVFDLHVPIQRLRILSLSMPGQFIQVISLPRRLRVAPLSSPVMRMNDSPHSLVYRGNFRGVRTTVKGIQLAPKPNLKSLCLKKFDVAAR